MELLTALLIGFAGSFHCIGMCGPIALALPIKGFSNKTFLPGRFLYNFGRVIAYVFLGGIFGLLGEKLIFAGFQQGLSISLGIFILIILIIPVRYRNILLAVPVIQRLIGFIKSGISKQFKSNGLVALLITGILNGFLPCGFVYVGLAAAAAAGTMLKGAAVMVMFGLGTVPVMMAVSTFSKIISISFRRKLSKAVPYFAATLAIIFILRGLSLGIKYISPKLSLSTISHSTAEHHCGGEIKKPSTE